jgi:23S rRNA pseudouridine1911/1915/1917 synthase
VKHPALRVVHCDNHLLVVEKPACMPTVPDASGDASLLEQAKAWIAERFDKPGNVFLGVVQRLDRPVSGVICFARTSKAAARLTEALRERRVSKSYWGVVAHAPEAAGDTARELEQWLQKDTQRNHVQIVSAGTSGAKPALTVWRKAETSKAGTLLELQPRTGRSHQLRVAAASLGCPLLGDLKYGAREPLPDRSIALHARTLELDHPTQDKRLRFEVPPPDTGWWSFRACDELRKRGATWADCE